MSFHSQIADEHGRQTNSTFTFLFLTSSSRATAESEIRHGVCTSGPITEVFVTEQADISGTSDRPCGAY